MGRGLIVWVFFLLWVALFAMSIVAALTIAPEGDGFTRGMNRFGAVVTWQGVALLVALVSVFVGARAETAGQRWLARVPILVQLLVALSAGGLVAYTLFTQSPD